MVRPVTFCSGLQPEKPSALQSVFSVKPSSQWTMLPPSQLSWVVAVSHCLPPPTHLANLSEAGSQIFFPNCLVQSMRASFPQMQPTLNWPSH